MARTLRPDMSVRQLAHAHPATRVVLQRYGEEPDRQVFGHFEPLTRFAERRGVELERLLQELAEAADLEIDRRAAQDDGLHRPFVLVALLVTLSLGAGWGAFLLAQIGVEQSFEAVSTAFVVAHGSAQLWGFVAIFIVGIALRYLVPATSRPAPPAAARNGALAALIVGVLASFAWSLAPGSLGFLGPVGGAALLAGALLYLALIVWFLAGLLRQNWARFVLIAAVFLCVWAGWTLYLQVGVAGLGPGAFGAHERQLVMDLALFGLALGSVYGFGRKLLPGLLSVPKPRAAWFEAAFWLHNLGLPVLLLGRWLQHAPTQALGLGGIAAGAIAYVVALRGLRGRPVSARRGRPRSFHRHFIRCAFGWLLLSMLAFVGMALFEAVNGTGVPHALQGAARHALTVGFLVTLMLGVAQRLLPILGNTQLAWPRLLLPVFLLIAVGNLLRVVSEVATVWWQPAFAVMPWSAGMELAALFLFSGSALRTMWPAADKSLLSGRVAAESRVSELLAAYPALEDELMGWGLETLRRVNHLPGRMSIASLAIDNGIEAQALVGRINRALRDRG